MSPGASGTVWLYGWRFRAGCPPSSGRDPLPVPSGQNAVYPDLAKKQLELSMLEN